MGGANHECGNQRRIKSAFWLQKSGGPHLKKNAVVTLNGAR